MGFWSDWWEKNGEFTAPGPRLRHTNKPKWDDDALQVVLKAVISRQETLGHLGDAEQVRKHLDAVPLYRRRNSQIKFQRLKEWYTSRFKRHVYNSFAHPRTGRNHRTVMDPETNKIYVVTGCGLFGRGRFSRRGSQNYEDTQGNQVTDPAHIQLLRDHGIYQGANTWHYWTKVGHLRQGEDGYDYFIWMPGDAHDRMWEARKRVGTQGERAWELRQLGSEDDFRPRTDPEIHAQVHGRAYSKHPDFALGALQQHMREYLVTIMGESGFAHMIASNANIVETAQSAKGLSDHLVQGYATERGLGRVGQGLQSIPSLGWTPFPDDPGAGGPSGSDPRGGPTGGPFMEAPTYLDPRDPYYSQKVLASQIEQLQKLRTAAATGDAGAQMRAEALGRHVPMAEGLLNTNPTEAAAYVQLLQEDRRAILARRWQQAHKLHQEILASAGRWGARPSP